jgi:thiamine biosynthesis lipoprotein ApbE
MAIPLEFMLTASSTSLSGFQLARLNEAANLKSEAREIMEEAERKSRKRMDDAFDKAVEAAVACWFRMHREELLQACSSISVPNEAEVRLWLREHGKELLKMCAGELPEKTGGV